jgi:hypothetical protein
MGQLIAQTTLHVKWFAKVDSCLHSRSSGPGMCTVVDDAKVCPLRSSCLHLLELSAGMPRGQQADTKLTPS